MIRDGLAVWHVDTERAKGFRGLAPGGKLRLSRRLTDGYAVGIMPLSIEHNQLGAAERLRFFFSLGITSLYNLNAEWSRRIDRHQWFADFFPGGNC